VGPHAWGRRSLPLLAGLGLAAGCEGVHSRQALYPNGSGRVVDVSGGVRRAARPRAPLVNLRVEPEPAPGPSIDGPDAAARGLSGRSGLLADPG
jgi:hypothetical protein